MLPWLLTRAPPDNARLRAAYLASAGRPLAAVDFSCIARAPLPWVALPTDVDVIMLTSAAAVERLVECWSAADVARYRWGALRLAVLFDKTAAALEARGLRYFVGARGGSVGLALALYDALLYEQRARDGWLRAPGGAPRRAKIVYLTSAAAADRPEHRRALEVLGPVADVSVIAAYQTTRPADLEARWRALGLSEYRLFIASPSAAAHFAPLARAGPLPRAVLCLGESTARAWGDEAIAGPVRLTPGPSLTHIARAMIEAENDNF